MNIENLIIQSGFAGLAVLLIYALIWIGKAFITAMKESQNTIVSITDRSNGVVRDNTEVIKQLREATNEQKLISSKLHEELLRRPCLLPKDH